MIEPVALLVTGLTGSTGLNTGSTGMTSQLYLILYKIIYKYVYIKNIKNAKKQIYIYNEKNKNTY